MTHFAQAPASAVASSSVQTPATTDETKSLGDFYKLRVPISSPFLPVLRHWTRLAVTANISDSLHLSQASLARGARARGVFNWEAGLCHVFFCCFVWATLMA